MRDSGRYTKKKLGYPKNHMAILKNVKNKSFLFHIFPIVHYKNIYKHSILQSTYDLLAFKTEEILIYCI